MKVVIQRTRTAELKVGGELISRIEKGLVVFFGVEVGDVESSADYLVQKIAKIRIFEDENGKMNKSVSDVGGEVLFVSQFTLFADTDHGNRPGFSLAERPERANELYQYAAKKLAECGIPTKLGVFGADMKITQENDGPITIIIEKK